MARKQRYEAVVLSVRIPEDKPRNYAALFSLVFSLRKSVRVFRDTGMALTSFDPKSGSGTISKFGIIDAEADWFDERGFGPATEADLARISIPDNLRPNLISKPFYLNATDHLVAVMTYSYGKGLTPPQVERFFKSIFATDEVMAKFGLVEVDLFKDSKNVSELLALKTIKEIRVKLRRPNHLPAGLVREIEHTMSSQNIDELEQVLKSKDDDYIVPSEMTKALAHMSSENGGFGVKYVKDDAVVAGNTVSKPLVEKVITDDPEVTETGIFGRMRETLFAAVRRNRERVDGATKEA